MCLTLQERRERERERGFERERSFWREGERHTDLLTRDCTAVPFCDRELNSNIMPTTINLDGTVGNWQTTRSMVDAELFRLGVAQVLEAYGTEPTVTATTNGLNADSALHAHQQRVKAVWHEHNMKGYGHMLTLMNEATREQFLRRSGTAGQVASAVDTIEAGSTVSNIYIDVERGSLRSLYKVYAAMCGPTTE